MRTLKLAIVPVGGWVAIIAVLLGVAYSTNSSYSQDKKPKADPPKTKPIPKVEKAPDPGPKDKAQPPKTDKAPPTQPPKGEPIGKVRVDVKVNALVKFKTEAVNPPKHHPPPRPGGSWHWHRWHGWMWFTVATAPPAILIPLDFVLPPTVVYYEAEAVAPTTLSIICPHCGKRVLVYTP